MDSIKAFITTQRQKGLIGPILIQAMMENFPEKKYQIQARLMKY